MALLTAMTSANSGLKNNMTLMNVIGNNISNVNTNGFRASRVVFSDVYYQTLTSATGSDANGYGAKNPKQVGYGSSVAAISVLNSGSSYTQTDRPLDQYIDGDGYFAVKSSAGNTYYTRLGNLYLQSFDSSNNCLVDANGNQVLDTASQPIKIPNTGTDFSIGSNGSCSYKAAGASTRTTLAAPIGLATFPNPDGLQQVGKGYYSPTSSSGAAATLAAPGSSGLGTLVSGALESSNVDLTNEFTNMIMAERGYQSNARVITTADEMLQELTQLKR